jgi:signal peptidase I
MLKKEDEFWLNWCKEELILGRTVRVVASGYSMIPTIWPGETVEISPISIEDVIVGDIIAFQRIHHIVVHRVIRKQSTESYFLLKSQGDSNLKEDEAITKDIFLGKVSVPFKIAGIQKAPLPISRMVFSLIAFLFSLVYRIRNKCKKFSVRYFGSPKKT